MFDLVIRNGLVVNADGTQSADVGIAGETIVQVGGDIAGAAREIDAGGLYVMPGGVDVHTHLDLDLPGFQTADDFRTGTIAAACGGTTTVLDFCQQRHGQSLREALDIWHAKAGGKAVTDYGFHIVITDMNADVEKELAELPSQGITSFKLFMAYKDAQMVDDRTMLRVFDVARTEGALVMVHAENGDAADYLIEKAVAAGNLSTINHALTRPPRVESEATGRAIALAELAGAPVYIVHLTCGDALDAVIAGRRRNVDVIAETCTHYLFGTQDDLARPDFEGAKWILTPPLRTREDQELLWRSLGNGTLSVVSSDDVSWPFDEQKRKADFTKIPNGAPGIEERMIMTYQGVNRGHFNVNRFVEIVSTNPARLFGLAPKKGAVAVGADADIVLWDPEAETVITQSKLNHAVDFTLFEGQKVKGLPSSVIRRGEVIVENGRFCGTPGGGQFVRRSRYRR
ncbi:MAG: dihydropyrimidinase [Bauldia sp.]|uniref:dihydropyrimidinase n=1 Tax=Bauldia sp. TaxID=2575872 RepID=UPI001DC7F172|nr:dihydropyrimidinase [Bauldia sp.]MCB1497572.1 dihydropyrimidinase [Bauldia sp.]